MSKKKDETLICPGCGQKCIQPVEIWRDEKGEMTDFLAIHSRKLTRVRPDWNPQPNAACICETFEGCDRGGKLPR